MDLLVFSMYLSNCAIYLTIAIYLFLVTVKVKGGDEFAHVKNLMAFGAVLLLAKGIFCVTFILYGVDYFLLDKFLVPIDFYFLFYIVTFALLKLMHSRIVLNHKLRLFPLPIFALFLVYCIAYVVSIGPKLSVHGYESFITMRAPRICSAVLAVIIVIEVILGSTELLRTSRHYRKEIGNYFSGAQELIGSRVSRVIWLLIIYVVFSVTDFISSVRPVDIVCTVVNTVVFICLSLIILNLHNIYATMTPAFRDDEEAYPVSEQNEARSEDICAVASSSVPQETEATSGVRTNLAQEGGDSAADVRRYIEEIVHIWSNREDKPYLKEGLTIAETAGQMGISPRLLSGYLNDIFEMNFNSWINMLRVEEVKRLIREGSDATMAELSDMSGFTDSSAMSKIFKRQEGVTPTQYRNSVRKSADSMTV